MKENPEDLTGLYSLILDELDIGVHVIDTQGRTVIYNRKMAELEAISPEEVKGRKLLEVLNLAPENSTLLTSLKNECSLENKKQSYFTIKGKQVTTVNSTLPLFANEKLIGAMELAKDITYIGQLAEKVSDLQEELHHKKAAAPGCNPESTKYCFTDILGASEEINSVIQKARQAARTDSSILIYGETGTGKELFAQSIHRVSPRGEKPFVAQNCAALPEELLEGILFGTNRGGFTGAVDRPGLFELAQGGTLLLDEINALPTRLQAKLLRVLQERLVRRVGGLREIPVDVRIISTCNVDPVEAIEQSQLRQDLFYRLSVVSLEIPPLRVRKQDVPLLTKRFITRFCSKFGIPEPEIAQETCDVLLAYDWPGNVRELEHTIEGCLNLLNPGETLAPSHLPLYLRRSKQNIAPQSEGLRSCTQELEKERILTALRECEGNISRTAAQLGISRQSLQYKLKKYNL